MTAPRVLAALRGLSRRTRQADTDALRRGVRRFRGRYSRRFTRARADAWLITRAEYVAGGGL